MARKFLYLIAILIVLAIGAMVALRLFPLALSRTALVPEAQFSQPAALEANAYARTDMWLTRPDMPKEQNPSLWQPKLDESQIALPSPADPAPAAAGTAAVFFVHPTSHWDKLEWNARIDDPVASPLARTFLRGMASPFAASGDVWSPKYRQATFGAFLSDKPDAQEALEAAYADVSLAFDQFLIESGERPIILAGHSQGAFHLLRLVKEKLANGPAAGRLVAVYAIGWPVSLEHDLPALGIQPCTVQDSTRCIASWVSFAEPADPSTMWERFRAIPALDGQPQGNSAILCSNPLTGGIGGEAPASLNRGTLKPDLTLTSGELIPGAVPAKCDASGLLLIGEPPQLGQGVLPGNNYHIYDIPLFWENLRRDALHRLGSWSAGR